MKTPRDIVNEINTAEINLLSRYFVAPYVPEGKIVARVAGLTKIFTPVASGWGWSRFILRADCTAIKHGFATPDEIATYLSRLPQLRMILCYQLQPSAWLCYPTNESDMAQKFGAAKPVLVHLAEGCLRLDKIISRIDGPVLWFEASDRKSNARESAELRNELTKSTHPGRLIYPGMSPEMFQAYKLAYDQIPELQPAFKKKREEERLRDALALGGGRLREFRDQGEVWAVEWTTRDGTHHNSVVSKADLTVTSAGLCLSGRDKDFDLQSLVGVVERKYTPLNRYRDDD